MLRTQIYLPEELRAAINKHRTHGESLSDYMRRAAAERVRKDESKKQDLAKLADEIFGIAKGTRTKEESEAWIEEIQRDRRLHDERLMKRWERARALAKKRHKK